MREPGYRPEPCLNDSGSCNAPAGNQAPNRKLIMRQTKLALALGVAFIASAHADTLPEFVGDTIVVTPTRSPQNASQVIADVTVITASQIAESGQTTLVEMLQAQPGIELKQSGGAGSSASVFVRGGNGNQVLVLVDGLRVSSATLGTTALQNISLDQVERIEILRGSASSLYGSGAVSGVIQVFTKQGQGAPKPSLSFGAGTYNQFKAAAGYGGVIDDTRFYLGAGYETNNGFSATNPTNFSYVPDDDGYRNANASINIEQQLSDANQIGFKTLYNRGRVEYDAGVIGVNDRLWQTVATLAVYSKNRLAPNWQSQLTLGVGLDDQVADDAYGNAKYRTATNQFQWQNDFRLSAGQLSATLEYNRQSVDSTVAFSEDSRNVKSGQLAYQLSAGAHNLFASARYDDYSDFGGQTTGNLGYGYTLGGGWRVAGSLGTSFKAPTFNDMYYPSSPFYVGNPNLRPEQGTSSELNLAWQDGPHQFKAVAYYNKVKDLIVYEFPTMQNVSSARLEGLEFTGQTRLGDIRLKASLDLARPEDETTGNTLVYRARQYGNLEAGYDFGNLNLVAQVIASGMRYTNAANTASLGGYAVVNLWGTYPLSPEWNVLGRLNNLLDKTYSLDRGYNMPGINAFVGFEYNPR